LELTAYCDESGTQLRDFCVGGWLAPRTEWEKLEAPWKQALSEAGLPEFKMRDCEMGQGLFKGRVDRRELQERFISLVISIHAQGYVSWIDLQAMHEVAAEVNQPLLPGFRAPYLLAFSMELQLMAHELASSSIPVQERVAFVFDRQDQYAAKALIVAAGIKANPAFRNRDRLGPVAFDDSRLVPAIQAADILAYEAHRVRTRGGPRWQWDMLKARLIIGAWDRTAIEDYARGLRLETGEKVG
jgi:hypothetical protein